MGASGSAWIKPKKRQGLRAAAITDVPHPRSVRTGQRYFPLDARARNPVTVRVVRTGRGGCEARREDTGARIVRLDEARLLAAGADGAGIHYRFVGYAPRTGYRTHACVVAVVDGWARLLCPEWHPAVPITVAAGGIPPALRGAGSWVTCKANLGATAAAGTGLHAFTAPAAGFDPSALHPVAVADHAPELTADARTEDVVLFLSGADAAAAIAGDRGVYVTGHAPPVGAGRRAYLCVDGAVTGWRAVAGTRPLPNGTRIVLGGPWHPVAVGVRPSLPAASVSAGRFGRQLWTTRTWRIEDERDAA